CSPILRTSSLLPLKAKALVREATCSPSTLLSTLISSSARPSEKYSLSLSALMLTKGRTASDGPWAAGRRRAAGGIGVCTVSNGGGVPVPLGAQPWPGQRGAAPTPPAEA